MGRSERRSLNDAQYRARYGNEKPWHLKASIPLKVKEERRVDAQVVTTPSVSSITSKRGELTADEARAFWRQLDQKLQTAS